MANTLTLIADAYLTFNRRDIDGALAAHERERELAQGIRRRPASSAKKRLAPTGRASGRSSTLAWSRSK
jgi:hypothetical protein